MGIQFKNTASPQTFHVLERHYRPAQSNTKRQTSTVRSAENIYDDQMFSSIPEGSRLWPKLTDRLGLHAASISTVQQAGPGSTPNRSMLATPTLKRSAHTSVGTHTYNQSTRESEELGLPQV